MAIPTVKKWMTNKILLKIINFTNSLQENKKKYVYMMFTVLITEFN